MPYLALRTNKTLTLSQEVELKTTVGKLITMFPGESVDTFMIHIEDNQLIYFKGQEANCMMITLYLKGHYTDEQGHVHSYTYTVEVEYDWHVLVTTLTNNTMDTVVRNMGLTEDQMSRYELLLETRGNKAYLFEGDPYSNPDPGEYQDYDIPPEALTDTRFANMIREAEKYLGYPYVWGGSSPSTSFDCSGFVSYVINHCGNGWSYGRQTADGLLNNCCTRVSKQDAKPGDLIFFQGTYDTAGASHVGIYVGNGMMIHCGNPIQYTSINTNYWRQHFYTFGRIN